MGKWRKAVVMEKTNEMEKQIDICFFDKSKLTPNVSTSNFQFAIFKQNGGKKLCWVTLTFSLRKETTLIISACRLVTGAIT